MIRERLAFKLVSHLLTEPAESFCDTLDDVIGLMDLVDEEVKIYFIRFIEAIQWMDFRTWCQHYNQTFEWEGSTKLYVIGALHEGQKDRQSEQRTIQQFYAKEGFRVTKEEFPDYLPAILKFACETEDSRVGFELLRRFNENIEAIKEKLQLANNFYVNLFEVILKTLEHVYESSSTTTHFKTAFNNS